MNAPEHVFAGHSGINTRAKTLKITTKKNATKENATKKNATKKTQLKKRNKKKHNKSTTKAQPKQQPKKNTIVIKSQEEPILLKYC